MERRTHISARRGWSLPDLREVWRYRDLVLLFTRKNFVLSYKQTILGPAWILLTPLISSAMYALVFGRIAGLGTDGVPRLLFYLSGTALWGLFSYCLTSNANTFNANAYLYGKVYFPRLAVPVSNVLLGLLKFLIQFALVFLVLLWYLFRGQAHPVWWMWLLLPLLWMHLAILGMSVGILISSLTTKYRDLAVLVSFGVQLWMYATPVVYPMSELSGGLLRTVLLYNPVTTPMELYRYALFGVGTVVPHGILISLALTVVLAFFGALVFHRVEHSFMDTV